MLLAFMSLINTNCESRGGGGVLADRREVKRGESGRFRSRCFKSVCCVQGDGNFNKRSAKSTGSLKTKKKKCRK